MSSFWSIVERWDHIGQGIFLLITVGIVATLAQKCVYYIAVIVRGWPPEHVTLPDDDD